MTTHETESRTELNHLPTKADNRTPYPDLKADIITLESNIEAVKNLRASLRDMERRLTWRLSGIMIAGFTIMVAVLRLWQ